jgi:hypothetical protein
MAAIPFAPFLMMALEFAAGVATNAPVTVVASAIGPYWSVLMLINFAFFIDLCVLGSAEGQNKYDLAPRAVSDLLGGSKPLLGGAELALERAIASGSAPQPQSLTPPAPVRTAASMPRPASAVAGSFGRRQVR